MLKDDALREINFGSDLLNNVTIDKSDNSIGVVRYSDYSIEFEETIIFKILNNWINYELDDSNLTNVDGYKARLLKLEELYNKFGYTSYYGGRVIYKATNNTPSWIYNSNYWTMTIDSYDSHIYVVSNNQKMNELTYNELSAVRPVINLKKTVLDNNQNYSIGDIVTYKDYNFYVIDIEEDYISLLKENPLSQSQIDIYGNLNNYIETYYYSSDTCNSYYNNTECTNEYDNSKAKELLSLWVDKNNMDNDLVEVNGYKVRLITVDELLNKLGYDVNVLVTNNEYDVTEYVPTWFYNDHNSFWTMSVVEDYNYKVYNVTKEGYVSGYVSMGGAPGGTFQNDVYYNKNYLRQVINLDKCVIGGCSIEEIEVEDGCIDDVSNNSIIVNVANTLKYLPQILIIGGCGVLGYNYIKSRRERK